MILLCVWGFVLEAGGLLLLIPDAIASQPTRAKAGRSGSTARRAPRGGSEPHHRRRSSSSNWTRRPVVGLILLVAAVNVFLAIVIELTHDASGPSQFAFVHQSSGSTKPTVEIGRHR